MTSLRAVRRLLLTVLPRELGPPERTWPAEGSRGPAHARAGANTLSALLGCQGTEEGVTQAPRMPGRGGAGAAAGGQISGWPAKGSGVGRRRGREGWGKGWASTERVQGMEAGGEPGRGPGRALGGPCLEYRAPLHALTSALQLWLRPRASGHSRGVQSRVSLGLR